MASTRSMTNRTRSSQAAVSKNALSGEKAKTGRAAFSDVSNNRRPTRASRSGRLSDAKPAAQQRKVTNMKDTIDPSNSTTAAPHRRRSLRASTVANTAASERVDSQNRTRQSETDTKASARTAASQHRKRCSSRGRTQRTAKRPREATHDTKAPASKVTNRTSEKKSASKRQSKSAPGARSLPTKRSKAPRRGSRSRTKPRNLCNDILYNASHALVRRPFDASKYTIGIADHDETKTDDVLAVSNYVTDIFQRLYNAETNGRPRPYLTNQEEINSMMRAILIDWLVEVHMKFRLVSETLYLCVNIIDRYCSSAHVERRKYQLVGVTALLIACKYEEIYPPEVRDCVYITDRAYTRQEVLDMEQDILRTLQFKMTVPTGCHFLSRFVHITNASELTSKAAAYYMERTLQEYAFLKYRPSLIAAASVCLALNNADIMEEDGISPASPPGIPQVLLEYTGFRAFDIKQCAALIVEKVEEEITTASGRELMSVKRKYDTKKFDHVSTEFATPEAADLDI